MSTKAKIAETMSDEGGFALPAMLLLVMVLSMLGTASLTTTGADRSAGASMLEAQRAFYTAEAGMNAVMEQWDQDHYDTIIADPGDSTVVGWTTVENGCEYLTDVRRIDASPYRRFYSVTSTGRSQGLRRAQRTVSLVLRERFILPSNAFTAGGDLTISGNAEVVGECGNLHTNGTNLAISGNITMGGSVSGSGIVSVVGGSAQDTLGNPVNPDDFVAPQPIPDLDPLMHCQDADYYLRGGYLVDLAADDSVSVTGSGSGGWRYNGGVYTTSGSGPAGGIVCADDDVDLGMGLGSPGSPLPISVLSAASIDVGGNPYITGVHPEGILLMAGGDIRISGNPTGSNANYEGLIYADAQCRLTGTPIINGMFVCRDAPNPAGSLNLAMTTAIAGDVVIRYNCNTTFQGDPVEPIHQRAWDQVID